MPALRCGSRLKRKMPQIEDASPISQPFPTAPLVRMVEKLGPLIRLSGHFSFRIPKKLLHGRRIPLAAQHAFSLDSPGICQGLVIDTRSRSCAKLQGTSWLDDNGKAPMTSFATSTPQSHGKRPSTRICDATRQFMGYTSCCAKTACSGTIDPRAGPQATFA
jgi:hypothetical protein